MLRPDHLVSVDRSNADNSDLNQNVAELVRCGSGISGVSRQEIEELVRSGSRMADGAKPEDMRPEDICAKLSSDLTQGLKTMAAQTRLAEDGKNELEKPPKMGFIKLFLLQLTSFIILLLIAAALASTLVNATGPNAKEFLSYTTGIAIFILVILNAGIAAYTEYQAGNALDALANMSQPEVSAIRDGEVKQIATVDLVKGDIVLLQTGDVVPADVRLFEASDVKIDEKALTGEPDDVKKNTKIQEQTKLTPENMVFSGCPVVSGKCKGIVISTGMDTRIGDIAKMMASKNKDKKKTSCGCIPKTVENQTPMQENVEKLGAIIGVMAIVICLIVFFIGWGMGTTDAANESPSWVYMILVSVTLAVAAIPEGIPLCVTISLAIGCKDMAKEFVQVRKIAAVETLGSASVICSDKTGTLTQGKMTMTNLWSCGVEYDVSGQGFDPTQGKIVRKEANPELDDHNRDMGVMSTLLAAKLCCDTTVFKEADTTTGHEEWTFKGNSSEAPIVVAAMKIGLPANIEEQYKRVLTVPFSSSRKMMLTVNDISERSVLCEGGMNLPAGSKFLSVCKGAPNWILESCAFKLQADGNTVPMSEADRQNINEVVDMYSDQALRVLAIAASPLQALPFDPAAEDISADEKFEHCKKDLILLGLVASIDPEREGVKDSVLNARDAGIRVVMITGDYLKTATAIAKNVQILLKSDDVKDAACDCNSLRPHGEDQYISEQEMDAITSKVRVFARAKPADKLEIVKSLQRQGLVSAMTGDGVNDAPALNEANIGVAMGIQGTEVAKGAAEMVLMDDNFTSIILAIAKGRSIYAGIQKFVAFIMSVHFAEVIQIFYCVVARIPLMRTPLQILFLILVTDLPPSIALGMEPPEDDVLKHPPRPKKEPIVIAWMWVSIIMNGIALSAIVIGIYLFSLHHYVGAIFNDDIMELREMEGGDADAVDKNLQLARTVTFISLVFCENVRAYTSRSFDKPVWRNLLGNPTMQRAVIMAQVAMLIAVLVPYLSDAILSLRGREIGWFGWLISLIGPLATLIICELCKLITACQMRRYQRKITQKSEQNPTKVEEAATQQTQTIAI
jgi:potassium/sodium efflux P-type ATPase